MKMKFKLALRNNGIWDEDGEYFSKKDIDNLPAKTEDLEVLFNDGLHYYVNISIDAAGEKAHLHFPFWKKSHDVTFHPNGLYDLFLAKRGTFSTLDGIGPRNLYSMTADRDKERKTQTRSTKSKSTTLTPSASDSQYSDYDAVYSPQQSKRHRGYGIRKADDDSSMLRHVEFFSDDDACSSIEGTSIRDSMQLCSSPATDSSAIDITSDIALPDTASVAASAASDSMTDSAIGKSLRIAVTQSKAFTHFKNVSQHADSLKSDLDALMKDRQRILSVMDKYRKYIAELETLQVELEAEHQHVAEKKSKILVAMKTLLDVEYDSDVESSRASMVKSVSKTDSRMDEIAVAVSHVSNAKKEYHAKLTEEQLSDDKLLEKIRIVREDESAALIAKNDARMSVYNEIGSTIAQLLDCVMKQEELSDR